MITTPRLNLRLPRSWNECTTEELETIASVMTDCAQRTTAYHPYDMFDVKVALFFALAHITILEPLNPRVKVEDQYYVCKHPDLKDPFNLYLWQIHYWVYGEDEASPQPSPKEGGSSATVPSASATVPSASPEGKRGSKGKGSVRGNSVSTAPKKKVKGLLDWLDDTQHGLIVFPYEKVSMRKHGDGSNLLLPITYYLLPKTQFLGPAPYMDGFSWQQYRFAQDYMSYYVDQSNRLLKLQRRHKVVPSAEIEKQAKTVDSARSMFLATIFNRKVSTIDTATGKTIKDFAYTSNQHTDNAPYFRHFPETKWQVILFWWTGMMHFLQKQYPHCFKKTDIKKGANAQTPLELYTRTTATMEKYLGLDEDKVNRQLFHLVFQHMEDMAKENEEIERMKRKKK